MARIPATGYRLPAATGYRLPATGCVDLRLEVGASVHAARVLRAAARDFLAALKLLDRELSILLTTDARIHILNRTWRGKDRATDVLSFPSSEQAASRKPQAASRARPLGDIVISLDTARRQAREGGWPLALELRRLLAHGLLHCLGHDHEAGSDARRMAAAERKLLGRQGMVGEAFSTPPARVGQGGRKSTDYGRSWGAGAGAGGRRRRS